MHLSPSIFAILALAATATCYRPPPPPPPRYLPHHPPNINNFNRRPHPASYVHHSAPRYPPRPRPPYVRPPTQAPPLRYSPASVVHYSPVQHVAPHPYQLQQVDDNSGPIHTIPAPKLGPHDRPAQFNESPHHKITALESPRPVFFGVQQEQQFLSHQQAYLDSNDVSGKTADGAHAYYAPDPDPSLPTKQIPPTFDPYSSPSNGRPPPADLLPSFNHNHNHNNHGGASQTVDSYGVPVVLHSFNYQEPYRRASNQISDTAPNVVFGQSVEEAFLRANQRQDNAQEAFPSVNPDDDSVREDTKDKVAFYEKVDGPVFSVLPNQEVAETLATLAAAGNINSNIISKAKDVQEAEDYVEEEILKAGTVEKADVDRDYITDEDKEVQLVFGTRIKQ